MIPLGLYMIKGDNVYVRLENSSWRDETDVQGNGG
jgi:hypothetical protein